MVKNFDNELWTRVICTVAKEAVTQKFAADESLKVR
jgi:hypothetical protein